MVRLVLLRGHLRRVSLVGLLLTVIFASGTPATIAQSATTVEIYAEGLVNPKGMAFGPNGELYVSEAGAPGEVMVPLPINFGGEGPIGTTGRVSRIPAGGGPREDFITGLPNIGLYGGVEMIGPTSMVVLDGQLYELAAGHMTVSPTLSRVADDGSMTTIADLGAFNDANPPPASNGDAVPMGNPYDIVAIDGAFYITDGNYNRVLEVTADGAIRIVAAWENSPVTVGAAAGPDGAVYVSQFSPAPYTAGSGRIDRVTPDGTITEGAVTGLTTPIDVAFAPDGAMYVLQYAAEFSPELLRYIPFGGQVLRVLPDGTTEPVVINLVFPTALTFGPDGALYVSNYGNEANEGQGHILRVVPGDTPVAGPDVAPPAETGSYSAPESSPIAETTTAPIGGNVGVLEPDDAQQWGYDPAVLTIQAGEAVVFTNTGRIAHTMTDSGGAFDTGLLKGGESITIVFDTPGTYAYFCQPHPWMKGTIIVEGAPATPTPEAAPATQFPELNDPTISYWKAALLVGLIVVGLFGAGFIARRKDATQPAPATKSE